MSWQVKDGNETLFGVLTDEKDEERQLRVYVSPSRTLPGPPLVMAIAVVMATP